MCLMFFGALVIGITRFFIGNYSGPKGFFSMQMDIFSDVTAALEIIARDQNLSEGTVTDLRRLLYGRQARLESADLQAKR